jgi:hypothetical protein
LTASLILDESSSRHDLHGNNAGWQKKRDEVRIVRLAYRKSEWKDGMMTVESIQTFGQDPLISFDKRHLLAPGKMPLISQNIPLFRACSYPEGDGIMWIIE